MSRFEAQDTIVRASCGIRLMVGDTKPMAMGDRSRFSPVGFGI
jgi:hypothetical protein